jgi:FMN reductase
MPASDVSVVTLVGNPRPGSRTATLATTLATALTTALGSGPAVLLDLAELTEQVGPPLGADSGTRYRPTLEQVLAADLRIGATPTYKGSYTGLLKSFLDHIGGGALHGRVAIPVTTVGSPAHTLAADVHLRPLLVELGASLPTAALVVGENLIAIPEEAVTPWIERNLALVSATLRAQTGTEPAGARS